MAALSPAYILWLSQQQIIKVCRVVQEIPRLYSRSSSIVEVWFDDRVLYHAFTFVCLASCPDIDMGTYTFR